jgi:alkylation response protein AidB-like acyl-CoA dehydrogenase
VNASVDRAQARPRDLSGQPDPVTRARRLAPLIAAAAAEIEATMELPPSLLDALHDAAMFRTLLPRWCGGDEIDPATFVEFMEILAAADASTAWCIGQASGCSMAAAYLDPGIAGQIWGDDPRAVLAWGAGPAGVAQVAEGGYRVTGRWGFASGGRHATWLGGHSRVLERDGTMRCDANGQAAEWSMLFPKRAAVMAEDWQVMGLRGTGSDSYVVTDLFIPADHALCRDADEERRDTGRLYRFSTTHLYASGFGAVALGIARATLDAFKALAQEKTPQATTRMLRDSAVVQMQVALAEAKLGAARSYLLQTLRDVWDSVGQSGAVTLDQRMAIRLAATFATHQAREVVDVAYHEAGATAIFANNPFERRFRDINTVSQQVQARSTHFETVGAHLLGLQPSLRFI